MSDKQPSLKAVLAALGIIKSADPDTVAALSGDIDLAKSIGSNISQTLRPAEEVLDNWADGHVNKAPTREQIKVGPEQEASGGGAEKMIREYSSPARQMYGTEQVAEKLDALMMGFGASMKALLASQKATMEASAKTNTLLTTFLAKASEDEEDEEDEESEVVEINASKKAADLIKSAKKLLRKAETLKADMEDMDDKDEKKSCKAQIKDLRKSAIKLLVKARTLAYAAKSKDLKADIKDIFAKSDISKADIDVVQEEEEEDDEEDEAAKAKRVAAETAAAKAASDAAEAAKAAAEKAKTDDKGNQADKMDPATGNQAASAKGQVEHLTVMAGRVEEALKGLGVLSTDVRTMLDVVAGKTKIVETIDVSKAAAVADPVLDQFTRINELEASGQLTPTDAFAAREIAQKLEMVKGGTFDASILKDRLSKASSSVRALYANVEIKKAS